jgi:hypothetical protein
MKLIKSAGLDALDSRYNQRCNVLVINVNLVPLSPSDLHSLIGLLRVQYIGIQYLLLTAF